MAIGGISDVGQTAAQGVMARKGRKFSKSQQRRAQQFALMMSSTAHQRAVVDLKAAGLNPVLTAVGPKAFATPSGSIGGNPPQTITRGASNVPQFAKLSAELAILQSQKKIAKNMEEESFHRVFKTSGESALLEEQALQTRANRELTEMRMPAARAQMALDQSEFGERLRQWNRLVSSVLGRDATSAR